MEMLTPTCSSRTGVLFYYENNTRKTLFRIASRYPALELESRGILQKRAPQLATSFLPWRCLMAQGYPQNENADPEMG